MKNIKPGVHVLLKHDPMFFRCDSEINDIHYLHFHIMDQDEIPANRSDIDMNSDIAQRLLGKTIGQHVDIPIAGTDICLDYVIVDISES